MIKYIRHLLEGQGNERKSHGNNPKLGITKTKGMRLWNELLLAAVESFLFPRMTMVLFP